MNTYCGDCRYFGAESGEKYGEVPQHICECKESIFKTCARTASGCDKYEKAESAEKTGHWITKIKSDLRGDKWLTNPKCSECGGEPYYNNTIYNYKFCPYCGVRMESGGNERDSD